MDMNEWGIVHELWAYGANVSLDGERLHVENGRGLPTPVIEKIKAHKAAIIEILENDTKAREADFLPLLPGEAYEQQISKTIHVFICKNETGNWDAWRETFGEPRTNIDENNNVKKTVYNSNYVKVIALEVATFDYVLLKVKEYMKKIKGAASNEF